ARGPTAPRYHQGPEAAGPRPPHATDHDTTGRTSACPRRLRFRLLLPTAAQEAPPPRAHPSGAGHAREQRRYSPSHRWWPPCFPARQWRWRPPSPLPPPPRTPLTPPVPPARRTPPTPPSQPTPRPAQPARPAPPAQPARPAQPAPRRPAAPRRPTSR